MNRVDPSLLLGSVVAARQDRVPRSTSAMEGLADEPRSVVLLRRPTAEGRHAAAERGTREHRSVAVVAIVEPLHVLRAAIAAVLGEAGYDVRAAASLAELGTLDPPFLIASIRAGELDSLAEFTEQHPDTVVVALQDPGSGIAPGALRAVGATGVIPRGSAPEAVLLALCASSFGLTVVPDEEPSGTAAPRRGVMEQMSDEERGWLRCLASGTTVAAIARHSAYSERELYRRLGRLYQKLGAAGRVEAMLKASSWGLL